MIDLYIDISSGASVAELINSIVSSGLIHMDRLVELLNYRFGNIAKFSYQSMLQDGVERTNLHVNGHIAPSVQEEPEGYLLRRLDEFGNQIIYDTNVGEMRSLSRFTGEVRTDDVKSLNTSIRIATFDLERLSERWPARIQLIGAAFFTILKTYDIGRVYVLDNVKLSNGMSYNLKEAWTHRKFLMPDECAALGALIAHGEIISREEFSSVIDRLHIDDKEHSVRKLQNVYFTGRKDKLYKVNTTRYNEYRNNLTK